jgi:hypothetical protein
MRTVVIRLLCPSAVDGVDTRAGGELRLVKSLLTALEARVLLPTLFALGREAGELPLLLQPPPALLRTMHTCAVRPTAGQDTAHVTP